METPDLPLCSTIPQSDGSPFRTGPEESSFRNWTWRVSVSKLDLRGLRFGIGLGRSLFRNRTWRVSVSKTNSKGLEVSRVSKRNDLRIGSFFKVGWSDLRRVFRWYRPAESEPGVLGPRNTLGKLSQRHWNSFLCRKILSVDWSRIRVLLQRIA